MSKANGKFRLRHPDHDPILVNAIRAALGELRGRPGVQPSERRMAEWRPEAHDGMAANFATARRDFLQGLKPDPRRDMYDECGYPKTGSLDAWFYQQLIEREPLAARAVEVLAKESWQTGFEVFEVERGKTKTPFEVAWRELSAGLRTAGIKSWHVGEQAQAGSPVSEALLRADILSGHGQYGIIVLGLDDVIDGRPVDLREPVAGVEEQGSVSAVAQGDQVKLVGNGRKGDRHLSSPLEAGAWSLTRNAEAVQGRKLKWLHVSPEHLAPISRWELNPTSPRWRRPVMYQVTFVDPASHTSGIGMPQGTRDVHWTRVVHVADTNHTAGTSDFLAVPRLRPILNPILDAMKVRGAWAEGFWKACFTYLFFSTHPQLGGDVMVDEDEMQDLYERFINGLQRSATLRGMSPVQISPTVTDATSQVNALREDICIKLGMPIRVFKGSERGELASTQDDEAWNDRLRQRRRDYVTPRIIAPFVDTLIAVGVLPEPSTPAEDGLVGWRCEWDDLTSQTAQEKAQVMSARTQAWSAYAQGQMPAFVPPLEFATRFDSMTEAEGRAMLGEAVAEVESPEETSLGLDDLGIDQPSAEGEGGGEQQPPSQEPPQQAGNVENASFFESCPRDERGHCASDGGEVSVEKTKEVAKEKAAASKDKTQDKADKIEGRADKGSAGTIKADGGGGAPKTAFDNPSKTWSAYSAGEAVKEAARTGSGADTAHIFAKPRQEPPEDAEDPQGRMTKKEVLISQLHPTQEELTGEALQRHAGDKVDRLNTQVQVIRKQGKLLIADGHHTVAAALARGQDRIWVQHYE